MPAGKKAENVERTAVRPRAGAGGPAAKRSANGPRTAGGRSETTRPGQRRELAGLALVGLALFLVFALVASEQGGLLGEWSYAAMAWTLGRLAVVIPAALLAVAGLLIFGRRPPWRSPWLWGGGLLFASVLLLVAAGATPVGPGHPAGTFVPSLYESRAGVVGEAMYAGVHSVAGTVGVALVGWLGALAGISLLSGLTFRRTVDETGRAATTVTARAAKGTRRLRERLADPADETGPLDPYLSGFGSGPESAQPEHERGPEAWDYEDQSIFPSDDPGDLDDLDDLSEEDLWYQATGRRLGERHLAPVPDPEPERRVELVNGAEAFPDLFEGHPTETGLEAEDAALPSPGSDPEPDGAEEPTEILSGRGALRGEKPSGDTASGVVDARDPASSEEDSAGGEPAKRYEIAVESGPETPRYVLPDPRFLKKSGAAQSSPVDDEETAAQLVETLSHFGVDARVIGTVVGPRVTRYELQLAPGTKVSKISNLKDDLAYALASTEIRILAPIPGKQAVGVEVPNRRPSFVTLGDIYRDFPQKSGPLMVWLGKDISGKPVYADLAKMPHLLIAGTTGSGKSGCVNCIISSILLRAEPADVRMILIDPKKVELSHYERIPHLLVPVVTNMKNAAGVLANVVREMENRYELMELEKARHLDEMNKNRRRRGEDPLPYLLVVVDELADLMMVSPAEVEEYIIRLAQKARAVGIHLVVATQRPSADVITGLIKANIPSRIAFAVSSQTDSRVILDVNGAETLLGMGDMLFRPLGSSRLQRVQGAFVTEGEIAALVRHVRGQAEPEFREELLQPPEPEEPSDEDFDPDEDELLADAAELVLETGTASVSMLQRRLRVGYTRAGRLIDMLERRGIVGPHEGSKARQILVPAEQREEIVASLRSPGSEAVEQLHFTPEMTD